MNSKISVEYEEKPIEATIKAIPPSQKIKIFDKPQFEAYFKDTGEYVNIPTMIFLGVFDKYRQENADHIFTISSKGVRSSSQQAIRTKKGKL